jgi:hypothetical protein
MNKPMRVIVIAVFAAAALGGVAYAQAPAGATGECKDGSYTDAEKKSGACSGHGGVKSWYGDKKSTAAPTSAKEATTPTTSPSKSSAAPTTSTKKTEKSSEMPAVAAAGGGPGKVWVNTSSNVYHCPNDKWYGKTKQGQYMSEADAKAKGNHAAGNKAQLMA